MLLFASQRLRFLFACDWPANIWYCDFCTAPDLVCYGCVNRSMNNSIRLTIWMMSNNHFWFVYFWWINLVFPFDLEMRCQYKIVHFGNLTLMFSKSDVQPDDSYESEHTFLPLGYSTISCTHSSLLLTCCRCLSRWIWTNDCVSTKDFHVLWSNCVALVVLIFSTIIHLFERQKFNIDHIHISLPRLCQSISSMRFYTHPDSLHLICR